MTKTELLEFLRNGENSGVEFKRDDVHTDSLAKETVALLNLGWLRPAHFYVIRGRESGSRKFLDMKRSPFGFCLGQVVL